jgi:hypothetical protein
MHVWLAKEPGKPAAALAAAVFPLPCMAEGIGRAEPTGEPSPDFSGGESDGGTR